MYALLILGTFVQVLSGADAHPSGRSLLRDGSFLRRVDGILKLGDSNDAACQKWFFELAADVTDGKVVAAAGTSMELLPSVTLERMAADVQKRSQANYRFWARVTKYRGRNYLFPTYFLPLSKVADTNVSTSPAKQKEESQAPEPSQDQPQPVINEPNDILALPSQIVQRLDTERVRRIPPEKTGLATVRGQQRLLLDRMGFLVGSGREIEFVLDAHGWNRPQQRFVLLPCEALEQAENRQLGEPEPVPFRVAGITTHYKGGRYLLLQKATRLYSHQNFDR